MTEVKSEKISLVLPRSELSAQQTDEMFALLSRHFSGVTRAQFDGDLSEKNRVILLLHDARLVGFSTLLAYEISFEGQPVSVIYSGDTIVAPEAWNSPALSRAWIACVRRLRQDFPRGKYYWLLITSGFRTYRFLPVFWRQFFPNYETPTPSSCKKLMDYLARERFGEQFDPRKGIVRFLRPQQLRNGLSEVSAGRIIDPHIAFFLQKNPGHALGDELVCLTELSDDNLTPAGRRMVETRAH